MAGSSGGSADPASVRSDLPPSTPSELAGRSAPEHGATVDDIALLVRVLPADLREAVLALAPDVLLEVILDLGRPPEARLVSGTVALGAEPLARGALDAIVGRVGRFGSDNRAGIEGTLHRISAIRNRRGEVVGLTLRVGRAVYGTVDILRDLVESGKNLLLLGRPGVGKTTKLREVARVLAGALDKRVMVIDTSNEIAGDGDIPHPGIGRARRMQVPHADQQHAVMIEAVENHMPEAIVVDEIGTASEAEAARTIAERGVQLVGTAHGNTLENLVLNPTLADLVGGVETVTLSDEEARRRGTSKTISERRAPPTFDIVVELVGRDEIVVHPDVADAVDRLLSGRPTGGQRRVLQDGQVRVDAHDVPARLPSGGPSGPAAEGGRPYTGPPRIYAPGIDRGMIRRVLGDLRAEGRVVDRVERADLVLALRGRGGYARLRRYAEDNGIPVISVKKPSSSPLRKALRHGLEGVGGDEGRVREAVEEAEHAIQRVIAEGGRVSLAPRPPRLRALQHRLVSRYHLASTSAGDEPQRHLVVSLDGSGEE